ncbi:transporter substrate-binding domain-containing protein [Neorhizobium sp. NCHU2750]|uniref:transporter substrate-binding domain-containing protein n=1 Tax=Neorhizobium sp. NCHU2750 TaxID=1825976 RepID=UPI000EB673C4|nr:amino acid ABC transporter substrate-binding protein [Neorhizobium sp. NCHU2750]AYD04851.1 amino acid ABC transporter substrate-binding protein [Neorhizobium sp. NCHU2750]
MAFSKFMKAAGIAAALLALPVTAFAGPVMDKIKETGKITVATEASYPPFEFVKDGKITGYGKDLLDLLVQALSKQVGKEVQLEQLDLPFQGILPGLSAGQFDFVATSVGINAERAKRYAYTRPIATSAQTVMIRAGDADKLKTPEDLNGKIVGTQMASASEPVVRGFDEKMKSAGKPGVAELKLFTSYPESYVALANGSIDAVVQSGPALAVLVKERQGVFKLMGPLTDQKSYLAWVARPEDSDFRDFVNKFFIDLNKSGKMGELQEKWFGFKMDTPDSGYLPEGAL